MTDTRIITHQHHSLTNLAY